MGKGRPGGLSFRMYITIGLSLCMYITISLGYWQPFNVYMHLYMDEFIFRSIRPPNSHLLSLSNRWVFRYVFKLQHGFYFFGWVIILRLGESQPGDLQGQLHAALAYIRALESNREAPSEPGSLKRANHLSVPGCFDFLSIFASFVSRCTNL